MTIRNNTTWPVLLILSTIFYVYRIPAFDFNVSFFRILYVLWLILLAKDITFGRIRWRTAYSLYVAMFLSLFLLNSFDLLRMSNVARYGRDIIGHLLNLSLVGLVVLYFDTEQKIERLIRVFSICSLAALAIAIFSIIAGSIPFEDALRADRTQFVVEDRYTIYSHGLLRLSSSFYDPNFYGLYLCFVVIFCLYLIYFNQAGRLYKAILVSAIITLVLTASRTSFAGLAIILLVTILKIRRSWPLIGLFTIAAFAGLSMLLLFGSDLGFDSNITARITDPESLLDRFNYIWHGLDAFDGNFIFGSGTESLVSDDNANASAHLVYLSWLAKYGIVGFVCYAFFLFYPLVYVCAVGRRLQAKYRYLITATYPTLIVMYMAYDYFAILEFQYLVFGLVYSLILNRIGLDGGSVGGGQAAVAINDHEGIACAAF